MKTLSITLLAALCLNNPLSAREQLYGVDILALANQNPATVFEQPDGFHLSLRPSENIAVFTGPEDGPEWYANTRIDEAGVIEIFNDTIALTIVLNKETLFAVSPKSIKAFAADRLARIIGQPLTIGALSQQATFLPSHIVKFNNGDLAQWYISRDGTELLISMEQNEGPLRVNLLDLLKDCGAPCAKPVPATTLLQSAPTPQAGYTPPALSTANTLEIWPKCPAETLRAAFTSALSGKVGVDIYLIEVEVLKACARTRELLNELVSAEGALARSYGEMRSTLLEIENRERAAAMAQKMAALDAQAAALAATEQQKAPPSNQAEDMQGSAQDKENDQKAEEASEPLNECPTPRPLELIEWTAVVQSRDGVWRIDLRVKERPSLVREVVFGEDFLGAQVIAVEHPPGRVTGQDCAGVATIAREAVDIHVPLTYGTKIPVETDPETGAKIFRGYGYD